MLPIRVISSPAIKPKRIIGRPRVRRRSSPWCSITGAATAASPEGSCSSRPAVRCAGGGHGSADSDRQQLIGPGEEREVRARRAAADRVEGAGNYVVPGPFAHPLLLAGLGESASSNALGCLGAIPREDLGCL
jgi:hypothetical protein